MPERLGTREVYDGKKVSHDNLFIAWGMARVWGMAQHIWLMAHVWDRSCIAVRVRTRVCDAVAMYVITCASLLYV